MIVPLGDSPNPRGIPYVTYGLIAVNCLIYLFITLPLSATAVDPHDPRLAEYVQLLLQISPGRLNVRSIVSQVSAYDLVVFSYGFRPSNPGFFDLFTAMFLHGGFMHLAGNMLFLWIYGDNVEHRLGRAAFLFWYLATGAAATAFHTLFAGGSPVPLVGASGAISGVLGFYFLWFPRNRVRLWVFLFPIFMNVIEVPARIVLGIYLFLDNVLPFLVASGQGGVAHGAHIGGFLAGLAMAWVGSRRAGAPPPLEFRADVPSAPPAAAAATDGIIDAVRAGRIDLAAQAYFSMTPEQARHRLPPAELLAVADWLRTMGHMRAALVTYQRFLRDYPSDGRVAEAHLGAGLVQLYGFKEPVAAYQHLVEVVGLPSDPATERQARAALAEIAALQATRRTLRH